MSLVSIKPDFGSIPDLQEFRLGTQKTESDIVSEGMSEADSGNGTGQSKSNLFPFPSPRKGQDSFLRDARRVLSSGGHLIAHAPTGLGKTAVALTASLEVGLENDLLVFFLTSKQSQHRIAVDTLQKISEIRGGIFAVDIISKESLCPLSTNPRSNTFQDFCELKVATRSCPFYGKSTEPLIEVIRKKILHVDDIAYLCRTLGRCPHKTAMDCFSDANVIICDYNYLFSPMRDIILERAKRTVEELVVVADEGHNLPARIRDHLRGEIGKREILQASREARKIDRELASKLGVLARALDRQSDGGTLKVGRDALLNSVRGALGGKSQSINDFLGHLKASGEKAFSRNIGTALLDLRRFLIGWADEENPILRAWNGEKRMFSYLVLDPSVLSGEIFKRAHSSILMSGTLYPSEMYSDLLGMPRSRCVGRTYASPFPRGNRRVVISAKMTTLFKRRGEKTYEAYANLILTVSYLLPGNLAVFFPSYEFLNAVQERMKLAECKKTIAENPKWKKDEKNQVLVELKEIQAEGGVLLAVMGGSLSEGIDFRDNLLSAAIICGIPLTPPTLENEALRRFYSSKFGKKKGFDYSYLIPAMNKIQQAAGRCIRSESDRAVIILADSRFTSEKYIQFLPEDFSAKEEDIESTLGDFFRKT